MGNTLSRSSTARWPNERRTRQRELAFWSRPRWRDRFPIALILGATLFDLLASSAPLSDVARVQRHRLLARHPGALGSFGAVFTGLALSKWTIGGRSHLWHHLFVWPGVHRDRRRAIWRLVVGRNLPARLAIYLLRWACLRAHRRRRILRRQSCSWVSDGAEITVHNESDMRTGEHF
jgi:hypothetical protein